MNFVFFFFHTLMQCICIRVLNVLNQNNRKFAADLKFLNSCKDERKRSILIFCVSFSDMVVHLSLVGVLLV